MSLASPAPVSTIMEQFREDGFYILRGFLTPDEVAGARREMERRVDQFAAVLLAERKVDSLFQDEPFETRLYRLYAQHMEDAPLSLSPILNHLEGLFPIYFNPRLLDLVEQILGPEIRLYPNYFVRPKFPDFAGTDVLWHQDAAYTVFGQDDPSRIELARMINCWTPLVPATQHNGCMQFVPGSHKLGLVRHVKDEQAQYLVIAPEVLAEHEPRAIDIEMDPGDVVFFSNLMFHQGQPNRSGAIRWSMDWRYQDARQSTMRPQSGHLARSREHPDRVVRDGRHWASLEWN